MAEGAPDPAAAYLSALRAMSEAADRCAAAEREIAAACEREQGGLRDTQRLQEEAVNAWLRVCGLRAQGVTWAPFAKWRREIAAFCDGAEEELASTDVRRIQAVRERAHAAVKEVGKLREDLAAAIKKQKDEVTARQRAAGEADSTCSGLGGQLAAARHGAAGAVFQATALAGLIGGAAGGCHGLSVRGASFVTSGATGAIVIGVIGAIGTLLMTLTRISEAESKHQSARAAKDERQRELAQAEVGLRHLQQEHEALRT